MTPRTPLTDHALETMLALRAARARPEALRPAIMTAVAATPQARGPLWRAPEWLVAPRLAGRPAWIVVTAGLLVALLAATAVVGALLLRGPDIPRRPADLVPTGLVTLAGEATAAPQIVADPAGVVWMYGDGALSRLDDASRPARTWTVQDDVAFDEAAIIPARGGGVWMRASDGTLRWFDGERFRDIVPGPPGTLRAVAEAPDRTLVAGSGTGVYRWDGSTWTPLPAGRPAAYVSTVAVDAAGWVWIGNVAAGAGRARLWEWPFGDIGEGISGEGVSVFDGTGWTTYDSCFPLCGTVNAILPEPGGAVWVATAYALARFDHGAWTTVDPADLGMSCPTALTAGPDGTVWVATDSAGAAEAYGAGSVRVARFDGLTWTSYGPWDGLPGEPPGGDVWGGWIYGSVPGTWRVALVATDDGVRLGHGSGVYRLNGDRWSPAAPATAVRPVLPAAVLAVSGDEAWAADSAGIWHWAGARWTLEAELSDPTSLARMPDGTLVAATREGLFVRGAAGWETVLRREMWDLAVDPAGTLWGLASGGASGSLGVESLRLDDPTGTLRHFTVDAVSGALAVAPDGTVWATLDGVVSRLRDGRWVAAPFDGAPNPGSRWFVDDLAVGPGGEAWVIRSVRDKDTFFVSGPPAVLRFDGSAWADVGAPPGSPAFKSALIAVAPDGAAWLATDRGLLRFDGAGWTVFAAGARLGLAMSIGPDGAVVVVAASGLQRLAPGR